MDSLSLLRHNPRVLIGHDEIKDCPDCGHVLHHSPFLSSFHANKDVYYCARCKTNKEIKI